MIHVIDSLCFRNDGLNDGDSGDDDVGDADSDGANDMAVICVIAAIKYY